MGRLTTVLDKGHVGSSSLGLPYHPGDHGSHGHTQPVAGVGSDVLVSAALWTNGYLLGRHPLVAPVQVLQGRLLCSVGDSTCHGGPWRELEFLVLLCSSRCGPHRLLPAKGPGLVPMLGLRLGLLWGSSLLLFSFPSLFPSSPKLWNPKAFCAFYGRSLGPAGQPKQGQELRKGKYVVFGVVLSPPVHVATIT